jgi:hypothetical protein
MSSEPSIGGFGKNRTPHRHSTRRKFWRCCEDSSQRIHRCLAGGRLSDSNSRWSGGTQRPSANTNKLNPRAKHNPTYESPPSGPQSFCRCQPGLLRAVPNLVTPGTYVQCCKCSLHPIPTVPLHL